MVSVNRGDARGIWPFSFLPAPSDMASVSPWGRVVSELGPSGLPTAPHSLV